MIARIARRSFLCASLLLGLGLPAYGQSSSPSFIQKTSGIVGGGEEASSAGFTATAYHGEGIAGTAESASFRQQIGYAPPALDVTPTVQVTKNVSEDGPVDFGETGVSIQLSGGTSYPDSLRTMKFASPPQRTQRHRGVERKHVSLRHRGRGGPVLRRRDTHSMGI